MKPSTTLFGAVALCLFSPLLFGFSLSFTSPTEPTMEAKGGNVPDDLKVFKTSGQASAFAAIINIGCLVGALLGSQLSDRYGRKNALAMSAVPMILTWPAQAMSSNWVFMTLLRFVMGLGVGIGSAVAPCYIGEVATLDLRGALGALNQLSITLGIFATNFFGTFVFTFGDGSFCQWRHLSIMGAALAVCILSTFFIPESPRYFAKQGKLKDLRASLMKLRKVDEEFDTELLEICNEIPALKKLLAGEVTVAQLMEAQHAPSAEEEQTNTDKLFSARYKKSLIAGIGLLVFQQLSGCNAIIFYVSKICQNAGMANPNLAATLAMAAQVVFTLIACLTMEKAGRKHFLYVSLGLCAAAHVALGSYFHIHASGANPSAYIALAAISVYIIGFSLGLGPIPWLLLAEIFPTQVRGSASSIAIATNWGCSFAVTMTFNGLMEAIGEAKTFFMFAAIVMLAILFTIFVIPETKGKNIEEVLELLNAPRSARRVTGLLSK